MCVGGGGVPDGLLVIISPLLSGSPGIVTSIVRYGFVLQVSFGSQRLLRALKGALSGYTMFIFAARELRSLKLAFASLAVSLFVAPDLVAFQSRGCWDDLHVAMRHPRHRSWVRMSMSCPGGGIVPPGLGHHVVDGQAWMFRRATLCSVNVFRPSMRLIE